MPAGEKHTLPKAERLRGRTTIAALMRSGKYLTVPGLRCCFVRRDDDSPSRMMVSVPKRLFKRAVKRNLIKRRLRESYRLQKELLPAGIDLMLIYTSPEIRPFAELFDAAGSIFRQIAEHGKG